MLTVEVFVAQEDKFFPFLGPFSTEEELREEIYLIREELQNLLEEAKGIFERKAVPTALDLQNMDAEQIWRVLDKIKDEQQFIDTFNTLHEEKRREIADFVFTRCNVFAGKASIFSLRYNSDLGLLE